MTHDVVPTVSPPAVPAFTHCGFFVLRTPLLPIELLETWAAPSSPDGHHDAQPLKKEGETTPEEEASIRAKLRALFDAPELRDALFIASPAVEEALRRDGSTTDKDKRDRLDASLTKYLMRMAGRCTPFGIFAGISVGSWGCESELRLAPRARYRRYTRIDMGYLAMLVDGLMREPHVRHAVRYRPNSTLYVTGGRARYVEHRPGKRARSYFLVSADIDNALEEVLALAQSGVTYEELARALARGGVELEEARQYVDELILGQVLEADLAPAVTGGDPMVDLAEQLARYPDVHEVVRTLSSVRASLRAMDEGGIGAAPQAYRDVATLVKSLPADAHIDRLFQVDMAKPVERLTLSECILDEISKVASALQKMFGGNQGDPFETFKKSFTERYGDREIPLLEALDDECGVGSGAGRSIGDDAAPLLAGLVFPTMAQGEQKVPWGPLQAFLLRRLSEGRPDPYEPIRLMDEDLARFPWRPRRFPNAFSVMLSLVPPAEEGGALRFLWHGLTGPSGARLLGRFCHTDPDLLRGVREHLRQEESLDPEPLHCEIVHLPEGRIGNVIARPLLRDHELVFLARAGTPEGRQISLTDLLVSVRAGRVVLRSKSLGREIAPRLTNAHNFSMGIGVYRFLAMLQVQGVQMGLSWNWGPFESLPFLPRVEYGNAILAPARWTVPASDIRPETEASLPLTTKTFQQWAANQRLPRWLGLREGDNVLPVDRDNAFSVRAMLDAVDRRPSFELIELPWLGQPGLVSGPEGTFANEVIIPLVQEAPAPTADGGPPEFISRERRVSAPSLYIPGSEWLFGRWNTAPGYADAVLVEVLAPIARELREQRIIENWFFIRYSDPDFHIRLRLRGAPALLAAEALPRLREAGESTLARGLVTKITYDTYDREVSRYGGPGGIELCERIFGADSDAVVDLVASTLGDEGSDARWRLTLCGTDRLLRDAGLGLEQRYLFARKRAEDYAREFHLQGSARHPIQDKFRAERKALLPLVDESGNGAFELAHGCQILQRRSGELEPIFMELRRRAASGGLTMPVEEILTSLVHMHVNRMLPSSSRAQEAVLLRFLENLYDSQLARSGKKKRDRGKSDSTSRVERVEPLAEPVGPA